MTKAAIFGLGSMGFAMAQSLLRAGLGVYGFDVRDERRRNGSGPNAMACGAAALTAPPEIGASR